MLIDGVPSARDDGFGSISVSHNARSGDLSGRGTLSYHLEGSISGHQRNPSSALTVEVFAKVARDVQELAIKGVLPHQCH